MKFDIVRVWKDEAYRQLLSKEELKNLEANPVGELDEADLAEVFGGDGPGSTPSAAGLAAAAFSNSNHMHSYGLLCDINVFSLDVRAIELDHLINIAAAESQVCIHRN
ncbi:MAG TPA: mersacidin/lichenicidin family type 2 lantibiotic [Ktedonobacteraceae bacterium]